MSDTSVQVLLFIIGSVALCFAIAFPIYLYTETDWGRRRRELNYLRQQRKRAERAYNVALLDIQDARYRVYDGLWRVHELIKRDSYER